MQVPNSFSRAAAPILILLLLFTSGFGQRTKDRVSAESSGVLWESGNISRRDLYDGPGGKEMRPDTSRITFIKEEKGGHNKKYRIKDGAGREWVAKLGPEAQPETAAVRLLYGLGYKTEINYLVPSLTIPGKGTFKNVRLEARPDNIERLYEWKWRQNPFVGTSELQGLKIMMVFMTNWDLLDLQNKVLKVQRKNGSELQYIISDLGATFGKLGNNNLPIFFRLGRKTGSPKHWKRARFVKRVDDGDVVFAFKGKSRGLMKEISVEDARWLADKLNQLTDKQLTDIFRAANYSENDVQTFKNAARRRITELDNATAGGRYAVLEK